MRGPQPDGRTEGNIGWIRGVLIVAGISQLTLGVWQAAAPASFFRAIGGFGSVNDHYLRDVATLYLALGAVLLIAAYRPAWRVPVLAFATLQYALHALNHVLDLGNASPGWVGPLDAASLAAAAVVLAALLRIVWRDRPEG